MYLRLLLWVSYRVGKLTFQLSVGIMLLLFLPYRIESKICINYMAKMPPCPIYENRLQFCQQWRKTPERREVQAVPFW